MKTRELSESERLMIYRLRINGQKYKEIVEKINCTKSGAQKAFKKIERLGLARNWLRSGRNRCTTERADRQLHRLDCPQNSQNNCKRG